MRRSRLRRNDDGIRKNDACNQCKGWSGDGAMGCCRGVGRGFCPNSHDDRLQAEAEVSEPSLRTRKHRGDVRWQLDPIFLFKRCNITEIALKLSYNIES